MIEGAYTDKQPQYEYIAHQINREDTLINNKMGWVLQLNGFLLASLALAGKDLPADFGATFRWCYQQWA